MRLPVTERIVSSRTSSVAHRHPSSLESEDASRPNLSSDLLYEYSNYYQRFWHYSKRDLLNPFCFRYEKRWWYLLCAYCSGAFPAAFLDPLAVLCGRMAWCFAPWLEWLYYWFYCCYPFAGVRLTAAKLQVAWFTWRLLLIILYATQHVNIMKCTEILFISLTLTLCQHLNWLVGELSVSVFSTSCLKFMSGIFELRVKLLFFANIEIIDS